MKQNVLESIDYQELGEKLRQARQKRGLTQADAASVIDVARTTLTAIEKGERRIKAGELIKLAGAYGQQISDFVRPRPQIESFQVQFRSAQWDQVEDDEQVQQSIKLFEEYCYDYVELEEIVKEKHTYRYPSIYALSGTSVEQIAESIAIEERNRLGLGDGPVPQLREVLENDVGLRIFYLPLQPSGQVSAMYTYNREIGGCIAINSLHPIERRRWSLAHEYAHFLSDREKPEILPEDGYSRKPRSERFADAFARFFLMPTSGLIKRYGLIMERDGKITTAHLCNFANYYGVSVAAMAFRLENMKLIKSGTWQKLQDRGFRVRDAQKRLGLEPITGNEGTFPKRYQYLAISALDQELLSEGQFARFLRVARLQARQIAGDLRGQMDGLSDEPAVDLAYA